MTDLTEVRKSAWRTRRKKYGKSGHNSAYSRPHGPCQGCERMAALIVKLHVEEILSEGQAAKAIGCGRIELRRRADIYMQHTAG